MSWTAPAVIRKRFVGPLTAETVDKELLPLLKQLGSVMRWGSLMPGAGAAVPARFVAPARSNPARRLADPALEARARAISAQLRCLVCQNELIDESGADLAHDIRVLVRERLTAGDTNAQATQAIVDRYGAFVLLRPPVEPATYVLWFAPPALVPLGLVGITLWLRRRSSGLAAPAPLSADERQRLDGLLAGTRPVILPFLLAVLAFVTVLPILAPLLRGTRPGVDRASFDQAVYRDQLEELDRDIARGLMAPDEAAASRLEIQRRLLAADRMAETRRPSSAPPSLAAATARPVRSPMLACALFVLVAAGSVGLYLWLGAPGVPDEPFSRHARRKWPRPRQQHLSWQQCDRALAAKLKADPSDAAGWLLYGRSLAIAEPVGSKPRTPTATP